jgi:hypothetical protein
VSLARSVPGDVRLFLELRDTAGMAATPLGETLGTMLTNLLVTGQPTPATHPADPGSWKALIGAAVGLTDDAALQALFSGRLAIAADAWSGLGDAVLILEPLDAAGLEQILAPLKIDDSEEPHVRRFQLAQGHEIASDGCDIALGRRTNAAGLFARTCALFTDRRRTSLNEQEQFAGCAGDLAAESQMIFYTAAARGAIQSLVVPADWWPATWPPLRAAAVGARLDHRSLIMEMRGRLETVWEEPQEFECPGPSPDQLPAGTTLSSVQWIDYSEPSPFWAGPLSGWLGFSGQEFQKEVISHLHGPAQVVLGAVAAPQTQPASNASTLPSAALCVRTSAPREVAAAMTRRLGPPATAPASTTGAPGRFAVVNDLLIVGTHPSMVGSLLEAMETRVPGPLAEQAEPLMKLPGLRVVLVARPRDLADTLGRWLTDASARDLKETRGVAVLGLLKAVNGASCAVWQPAANRLNARVELEIEASSLQPASSDNRNAAQ